MSNKVRLTIVIEDAQPALSFLFLGFLSKYGYYPINKKTHGSPGKLSFVYKKRDKK